MTISNDAKLTLINNLMDEEGYRQFPYKDIKGIWSIGFGMNIEAGIDKDDAMYLLHSKVNKVEFALEGYDFYRQLESENRKMVLIDMAYNLGIKGLLKFIGMINAIYKKDFEKAATEMMNSEWAKQVPKRATFLSALMLGG